MESPHGSIDEKGVWEVEPDPLVTALSGIRLTASLRARPEVRDSIVLSPDYSCDPRSVDVLRDADAGATGPDVTVRAAEVSSPFHDRLLLLSIQSDSFPPRFVIRTMDLPGTAGWFRVISQGLEGPRGQGGSPGEQMIMSGSSRCQAPRIGTNGGVGGIGGKGGDGSQVVVLYDQASPHLTEIVIGMGAGGPGGLGGAGGTGGVGASGQVYVWNSATETSSCQTRRGRNGRSGPEGPVGERGEDGPEAEYVPTPFPELFRDVMTPELRALLDYHRPPGRN